MRRYVYFSSAIAAGVLLDELAYWAVSRIHGLGRGVRVMDRLRAAARF